MPVARWSSWRVGRTHKTDRRAWHELVSHWQGQPLLLNIGVCPVQKSAVGVARSRSVSALAARGARVGGSSHYRCLARAMADICLLLSTRDGLIRLLVLYWAMVCLSRRLGVLLWHASPASAASKRGGARPPWPSAHRLGRGGCRLRAAWTSLLASLHRPAKGSSVGCCELRGLAVLRAACCSGACSFAAASRAAAASAAPPRAPEPFHRLSLGQHRIKGSAARHRGGAAVRWGVPHVGNGMVGCGFGIGRGPLSVAPTAAEKKTVAAGARLARLWLWIRSRRKGRGCVTKWRDPPPALRGPSPRRWRWHTRLFLRR